MTDKRELTDTERQAALYAALARAQGSMEAPKKSRTGARNHRYSSVEDLMDVAVRAFSSVGIAITQSAGLDGSGITVRTTLAHESGGTISGEVWIPVDAKGGAQAAGSAITYGRRYCLSAVAGIGADCGGEDDGEETNAPRSAAKPRPSKSRPPTEPRDDRSPRLRLDAATAQQDLTVEELRHYMTAKRNASVDTDGAMEAAIRWLRNPDNVAKVRAFVENGPEVREVLAFDALGRTT